MPTTRISYSYSSGKITVVGNHEWMVQRFNHFAAGMVSYLQIGLQPQVFLKQQRAWMIDRKFHQQNESLLYSTSLFKPYQDIWYSWTTQLWRHPLVIYESIARNRIN